MYTPSRPHHRPGVVTPAACAGALSPLCIPPPLHKPTLSSLTFTTPKSQVNGHFAANLDPLGLDKRPPNRELDPASFGFTEADLDRE